MSLLQFLLLLDALLGSALIAGLYFAFSVAVMRALARRPPAEGMAAMQAINAAILNPVFMLVFLGTPALCLVLAVMAVISWAPWQLAGSLLHIVGSLAVTMVFNVPLNNRLAKADPAAPSSLQLWQEYLSRWTAWNHVRTVVSLAATGALAFALRYS